MEFIKCTDVTTLDDDVWSIVDPIGPVDNHLWEVDKFIGISALGVDALTTQLFGGCANVPDALNSGPPDYGGSSSKLTTTVSAVDDRRPSRRRSECGPRSSRSGDPSQFNGERVDVLDAGNNLRPDGEFTILS